MQHIIPKPSAETIKRHISPKEYYQSEIDLTTDRSYGWVEGGFCPFHDDSRPGSFYVNLDSGGFNCFSCGSKGGDVIAFIQLRDGLSFPETLHYLKKTHGVG
jgi:DNA primase